MKKISIIFLFFLVLVFPKQTLAVYDPSSVSNNKFGIHILFPEEVSEASTLINSSGGDWGYVTIPIQASDKNLIKWQKFMDDCRKYHLIPIVRLATNGDYFNTTSWSAPNDDDVLDFANFLNSLDWPTKNRYIVVYNETNRADEWGGSPDPSSYAQILDYTVKIFKQRNPDFFIIAAGLDNASINISGKSMDEFTFMRDMENAVPGIFSEIDGIASHSYPNPGFSSPPNYSRVGIDSFYYQNNLVEAISGKNLPVFITETGWSSQTVSYDLQSKYYQDAFSNYWDDKNIIAVTPFLFKADQGSFSVFSFIKTGSETPIYKTYKDILKPKGNPKLTPEFKIRESQEVAPKNEIFNKESTDSVIKQMNNSTKSFFKWLLKI